MATACRVLFVALLLVAASCGGSSSSQPAPIVPGSTTLDAEFPRSVNASSGQTAGGQLNLGEYGTNTDLESRAAFRFDLTSLPAGSVVTQATLTVYVTPPRAVAPTLCTTTKASHRSAHLSSSR